MVRIPQAPGSLHYSPRLLRRNSTVRFKMPFCGWRERCGITLAVIILLCWLLSLWRTFGVCLEHDGGYIQFGCSKGLFFFSGLEDCGFRPPWIWMNAADTPYMGWMWPEVTAYHRFLQVILPHWWLVSAATITTALFWRPGKHKIAGTCEVCDYNLTGNTSGVCPECGVTVSSDSAGEAEEMTGAEQASR